MSATTLSYSPAGPLAGVKILDLATAIAAPFATSLLADQGAEVIKVESPGIGDILRYVGASRNGVSAMFSMTNRNKRSLALDLKSEAGLTILKKLVANHDVLIHNFRPGVAERLGIDYDSLKQVNAELIYVSVSGFGHVGPAAGKRAYDNVIQAYSGLAFNQANPETGEPVQNYQAIADKLTALTAAQAIPAALFARSQGQGGQHIHLNMVDSVLHFLWMDAAGTASFLEPGANPGQQVAKGVKLIRFRNGWGQAAPLADSEFHGMCKAFGVDSRSDPRLASVMDRMANREAVEAVMAQVYEKAADMDVDIGVAAMEAEDVPCAKAMTLDELPDDPQIQANQSFVSYRHPVAGDLREPRAAAQFGQEPARIPVPCAALGADTDEILNGLGMGAEIASLRARGVVV